MLGLTTFGAFHTTTRLPVGAPLVASPDEPELVVATGVLFVIFLIGSAAQAFQLRRSSDSAHKA